MTVRDHISLEAFQVITCPQCTAAYLGNPPSPIEMPVYYKTVMGDIMHHAPNPWVQRMRGWGLSLELRQLLQAIPKQSSIVDVGSGDGFAAFYLHQLGYATLGLDLYPLEQWSYPNIPYRQTDLHGGALKPSVLLSEGRSPTAVVMRHVLEHLHCPDQVFEAFVKAGIQWVYLVVPNFDSPGRKKWGEDWYYWDPPRHLIQFTRTSVCRLAERTGFHVKEIRLAGLDETFCSLYRRAWLQRNAENTLPWWAELCAPKGLLSGLGSAITAPFGKTVIQAILQRNP
jgi:Methyltransferase domain